MKNKLHCFELLVLVFVLSSVVVGQITNSVFDDYAEAKTIKTTPASKKVDEISAKAGVSFKQGLLSMLDNRRLQANINFNAAVETFLMSGVNINDSPQLQSCFNQVVETIYRIEFPSSAQQPQSRQVAATCGWNWNENDYKTADAVAKLVLTAPAETSFGGNLISPKSTVASAPAQGFNEQKIEVSPLDDSAKTTQLGVRIIEAKAGDTLSKLAQREGVSAVELAKYNGLLPSSILPIGRDIKIPSNFSADQKQPKYVTRPTPKAFDIGEKPLQAKSGKVQAVMDYINENFNDPYSIRFVKWSPIEKGYNGWNVTVRFRAKNGFNAYILSEMVFYIRKNKVVDTIRVF